MMRLQSEITSGKLAVHVADTGVIRWVYLSWMSPIQLECEVLPTWSV